MNPPRVSVVIPTFNRQELLAELIAQLARQTLPYSQFEVLVVDDGSTDGTRSMLAGTKTPFELMVLSQNRGGPAAARNRGARHARGEVLIFLDDDVEPDAELLAEHLAAHRDAGSIVVLGRLVPWEHGRRGGWHMWEERVFARHYRRLSEGRLPPGGRRLYSGNFSVARSTFLAQGGFDESLKRGEDVELGFRLERGGCRFVFSPAARVTHKGRRSFAAWRRSAYLYGQTDIQLATQRGQAGAIAEVFDWYCHKPWFARAAVKFALFSPPAGRAMVRLCHFVGEATRMLGLMSLSHRAYSAIFNLEYWPGASDALGGRAEFARRVTEVRGGRSAVARPIEPGAAKGSPIALDRSQTGGSSD